MCFAGLHLFDEAIDFLLIKLGKDKVFAECFLDLDDIVGGDGCFFIIFDIILHFDGLVGDDECVFASPFLIEGLFCR